MWQKEVGIQTWEAPELTAHESKISHKQTTLDSVPIRAMLPSGINRGICTTSTSVTELPRLQGAHTNLEYNSRGERNLSAEFKGKQSPRKDTEWHDVWLCVLCALFLKPSLLTLSQTAQIAESQIKASSPQSKVHLVPPSPPLRSPHLSDPLYALSPPRWAFAAVQQISHFPV